MLKHQFSLLGPIAFFAFLSLPCAGQLSPADWGAPPVAVSHANGKWTIAGKKNTVVLDEKDLSFIVNSGQTAWRMVPSSDQDMLVDLDGDQFHLRLADAPRIAITPYATGFKSGVKIVLDGFRSTGIRAPGAPVGIRLYLTMALEGGDEDLDFEISAVERHGNIRLLNWPTALDGSDEDNTVLSNDDGMIVPRNWPTAYYPIHRAKDDTSIIQSDLIESWSMSWWGFEKGPAAMMVIVETPDDAAYTFSHPAGGPTVMGPQWRAQLNRFGYLRSMRMVFFPKGNYVDMCKRYRRYVIASGQLVPLKEKIARDPLVANLIGNPFVGASVLRNVKPGGPRYDTKNPANNYHLTTFEQNIERLRKLKADGFEHLNVSLSGWPNQGYDRQHPDGLPPNAAGGGWAGMKAFFDACKELGYTCWLHDQYRDYYPDAPSFNTEFAVYERDSTSPPTHFPGTRFHPNDWKEGYIPYMNYWDGGTQAYLDNRYMLGHVEKNYRLIFEHGIHPQGAYDDVFGYIPPDQDFNPEHPSTRTESMKARALVLNWVRSHLGVVGVEDGADWIVPYADYATSRFNRNPSSGNDSTSQGAIVAPLYDLVYHDAIVTTDSPDDLRSFLYGHAPQVWRNDGEAGSDSLRRMAALHKRVGLLEMTNHEFLDAGRTRERTTFADGTTVTVDWQKKTVDIKPDLDLQK